VKILKSKRKGNIYSLEIEESPEEVEKSLEAAFIKLSKSAKIPGFRQGKITRSLFEKHYGKEVIVQEALMDVVNIAYSKAIKELNLFVVDYPKNIKPNEYKEGQPFSFSCDVDVKPEVKLGKYKGIKIDKEKETIEESQVQDQIEQLKSQYAQYNPVERACQDGDIIRCNIEAKIDDVIYEPWTKENTAMVIGIGTYSQELDTKIIGMEQNQEKSFSITYKKDAKATDLIGKTLDFKVSITEIREKKLPEFNDEFAVKASKSKTAKELEKSIRSNLEKTTKQQSENKLKTDLLDAISENAKADIQAVMIQRETEHSLKEFERNLAQSKMTFESYSQLIGKDIESLKKEFEEGAKKRIKSELVLEEIAKKETIEASEEDLMAEVKKWNMPKVQTDEEVNEYLKKINTENFKYSIIQQKTLDFLIENAKITTKKK
jgi:trigger factor